MALEGQRALLTGAGKGLGRAMAHALAAQGVHVIVTDRNEPLVTEVSEQDTDNLASRAHIASNRAPQ
jgi:NAD(P)-dependent dehydrogenase (short-subunit alcohol dehydrogenase family)